MNIHVKLKDNGTTFFMRKFAPKFASDRLESLGTLRRLGFDKNLLSKLSRSSTNDDPWIIPVILDYGRNSSTLHYAAFIVFPNTIVFYEPYGVYAKYGISYKEAICSIAPRQMQFWHDLYHPMSPGGAGLQMLMLEQNTSASLDLPADVLREIQSEFDLAEREETKKTRYNDPDQTKMTFHACQTAKFGKNAQYSDKIFWAYGMRSNKLCVSITLVELGLWRAGATANLKAIYTSDHINREIMKYLLKLKRKLSEN